MSHVETARVSVVDLKALKAACTRLGVEFVEGAPRSFAVPADRRRKL